MFTRTASHLHWPAYPHTNLLVFASILAALTPPSNTLSTRLEKHYIFPKHHSPCCDFATAVYSWYGALNLDSVDFDDTRYDTR